MKQHQLICGALLAAACSFLPALAQIEKPSESELDAAPSQFQDLLHGKSKLISQSGPNAPKGGGPGGGPPGMAQSKPIKNPSTDPHDLTGYWARGGGFGGPPGGGGGPGGPGGAPGGSAKPGGAPARGGNPFGSGPPAQPGIVGHTKIDASRLCAIAPGPMTTSGRIYQDATKLTIVGAGSDMGDSLRARRIYFASQHDPNATASYNGDSIAHWEGNTLVVDTIKLKGLITSFGGDLENGTHNVLTVAPDLHVVERITKSADGSSLNDDQTWYAPAESKTPYHTSSTTTYSADPLGYDAECEDVGDMFGPNYGGGV